MTDRAKPFFLVQLEKTFENRSKINPRYSLRAFARDLNFSAPRLSGVLNQKFGLSAHSARQICAAIPYDPKTTEAFITSVQAKHARSPRLREVAAMRLKAKKRIFNQLELERFDVVSDWYHFAIMELTRTDHFQPEDFKKIAQQLQITFIETKNAIHRLLELQLLKIENGFLCPTGSFWIGNLTPNLAIQNLNTQLIKKALHSVRNQTLQQRDLRTLTLAIAEEQIPQFNQLFSEFQTRVRNLAESNPTKTNVYAWTMQFYSLSERKDP